MWKIETKGKPEPGEMVLVLVKTPVLSVTVALWYPKFHKEDDQDFHGDISDYDEVQDKYFWPEGWYEQSIATDTYWTLSDPVIAWQTLPSTSRNGLKQ